MDVWYNLIDSVTVFYKKGEVKTIIATFKVLFTGLSLVFLAVIIWLRVKAGYFSDLKTQYSYYGLKKKAMPSPVSSVPLAEFQTYWQGLSARLNYQDDAQWKLAVIEADNFFDYILGFLGYQGESMAEKLQKIMPGMLKNMNNIWQAHKIRNALVHDPTFKLSYKQAVDVINIYTAALKEFKMLE